MSLASSTVISGIRHQGESFLDRFDALSYLYLSRVMDYFDPFADPDAVRRLAGGGTPSREQAAAQAISATDRAVTPAVYE